MKAILKLFGDDILRYLIRHKVMGYRAGFRL